MPEQFDRPLRLIVRMAMICSISCPRAITHYYRLDGVTSVTGKSQCASKISNLRCSSRW